MRAMRATPRALALTPAKSPRPRSGRPATRAVARPRRGGGDPQATNAMSAAAGMCWAGQGFSSPFFD